jgi:hypothetical protein
MKNSYRMFMGVLLTTLVFLVAAREARAQDVVKVSPETHKVLLENDEVRVLDVHSKPGEKVGTIQTNPGGPPRTTGEPLRLCLI